MSVDDIVTFICIVIGSGLAALACNPYFLIPETKDEKRKRKKRPRKH